MIQSYIFLSIYTGSLIHEHYTRECEFGNFDKIKNKNNTKKQIQNNTKKHKNFLLNFCLNKECPKLLCGLGICHRRRQTIPMWNSSGGGGRNPSLRAIFSSEATRKMRHI